MNKNTRRLLFERLSAQRPNPTTELLFDNGFELLIAVMLSAQSTDVAVNKVTRRLYPVANTPEALLTLGEERLESYLKTLGLYRAKTRNVLATCQILLEKYASAVPRDRAARGKELLLRVSRPAGAQKRCHVRGLCLYAQSRRYRRR